MIKALKSKTLHKHSHQSTKNLKEKESQKPLSEGWNKVEDFVSVNPVMGRVFIEIAGDGINSLTSLALGRSPLFALENLLAPIIWASVGVTFPVFVINGLLVGKNSKFTTELKNSFAMQNEQPLKTTFSKLDEHWLSTPENQTALIQELGLKNKADLMPTVRRIRQGKLIAMITDMFTLAATSAGIYYLRNWLTWLLAGKKEGYSGEFTYATDAYVKQKAEEAKKNEAWRHKFGVIMGFVGNLSAPLLCWFILRSPRSSGLKKFIPAMEYTDGIYLSRWLMVFHVLFNYNLKQIFAFARSINETLESIVKALGFDFLFFIGDDLIAGATAKYFQKKHKAELGDIELTHKGPLGTTLAKPMRTIEKEIESKHPELKELAQKLARYNFRSGLLATSALLGVFLSTVNALQTKSRIQNEGGSKSDDKK